LLDRLVDRTALSIDWDPASLRVVQVRLGRGSASVVRALTAPMPADLAPMNDADGLGRFLRRVLDQEGIRVRRVMVDVARHQTILNSLALPDAPPYELINMVRFQAAKDLPFAQDEAVLDFVKSGLRPDGKTVDVLVAAIREDVLAFQRRVCATAGLRLTRVGLRPYATSIGVMRADPGAAGGRTLVVDVGPRMTEIDLIRDGHLVFSRSAAVTFEAAPTEGIVPVSPPGTEETADEAASAAPTPTVRSPVGHLEVEITRSFEAYRATDPGCQLDRIIVAGATGAETEIAAAISQRLRAPATMFNPAGLLERRVTAGGELCGFAAAIGLALSHTLEESAYFDFLHPKKATSPEARRLKRLPLAAASAALSVAAVAVGYWQWVSPKYQTMGNLKQQIKEYEANRGRIEELAKRVREVEEWKAQEVVWLDDLYLLTEAFPDNKENYLLKLTMDNRRGRMVLQLASKQNNGANELANSLCQLKDERGRVVYQAEPLKSTHAQQQEFPYLGEVHATRVKVNERAGVAKEPSRRGAGRSANGA